MNEENNVSRVRKLDAGAAKPITITKEEAYKLASKKPKKIINRVIIKPKEMEEQEVASPKTLNIKPRELYQVVEVKNNPKKMVIYGILLVIIALVIIFWTIPLLKTVL